MNVNKKFDRLRQWGKERMGGDIATNTTDDFKALEVEMDLRHKGTVHIVTARCSKTNYSRHGPLATIIDLVHQIALEARTWR